MLFRSRSGNVNIGVVGAGVIGGGWAARFLLHGHDVAVYEPSAATAAALPAIIDRAARAYAGLGYDKGRGTLTMVESIDAVCDGAAIVQESVPEVIELKQKVLGAIDAASEPAAIIGSSTSGLLPTKLQESLVHPDRKSTRLNSSHERLSRMPSSA